MGPTPKPEPVTTPEPTPEATPEPTPELAVAPEPSAQPPPEHVLEEHVLEETPAPAVAPAPARPPSTTKPWPATPPQTSAAPTCYDFTKDPVCEKNVKWAMKIGIYQNPEWYKPSGLTSASGPQDFQMHLSKERHRYCLPPCGFSNSG